MSKYYYMNEKGVQSGPIDESEFIQYGIKPSTLVWTRGMKNWQPAGEIINIPNPSVNIPNPQINIPNPSVNIPNPSEDIPNPWNSSTPPDNYLVWAIIEMCCCNTITGAVALYYANQVTKEWNMGNTNLAKKTAEKVKKWLIAGVIISVVMIIIGFIVIMVIGMTASI